MASSSTHAFFHCHYAFQKFPFFCVTLCVLHGAECDSVWIPRDEYEYHETNLNITRRIWIPRDEFEYHETNLNTTRRIWIPRDEFEYHETNLNTARRIWIPRDEFEYHETNLNSTRRIWIPRDGFECDQITSQPVATIKYTHFSCVWQYLNHSLSQLTQRDDRHTI